MRLRKQFYVFFFVFYSCFESSASAGLFCNKPKVIAFQNEMSATIWEPKTHKRVVGNVLILPSSADKTVLDEMMSRKLCRRGIRSIVLNEWKLDRLPVSSFGFYDALIERTLHFSNEVQAMFPGKYGISGSSLGAIVAMALRGIDHRFGPAVSYNAGGDIAWLLAWTTAGQYADIRNAQMRANGVDSQAQYEEILRKNIKWEPGRFADPLARKEIRFFGSEIDEVIATPKQIELWEAWGKPYRVSFYFKHTVSIIIAELLFSPSNARFFARHLK